MLNISYFVYSVKIKDGRLDIYYFQTKLRTICIEEYMKSFIAKRIISKLVNNCRYLRFKLLKYEENNKKIM